MYLNVGKTAAYVMKLIAMSLPLFFYISSSYAADRPDWINRKKPDDETYKYYVGTASSKEGNRMFSMTYESAIEQAVKENFGAATDIESQSYSDMENSSATKRIDQKTMGVIITDFTQVDYFKEGSTLSVLYSYRKSAIEKERVRLKMGNIKGSRTEFSVSAGYSKQKGSVEIETYPEDVQVFIDEVPWGFTPINLRNKLEPGKHTVRLEHIYYDAVYEQLIIVPNDTVKITKKMHRANGSITIESRRIKNADVIIDGSYMGKTPYSGPIEAGIDHTVRLKHSECHDISETVLVSKYESKNIELNPSYKGSTLHIISTPLGAAVYLNGTYSGATPCDIHNVAAHQDIELTLKKEGFIDSNTQLQGLSGGENRRLECIALKSISQKNLEDQHVREEQELLRNQREKAETELKASREIQIRKEAYLKENFPWDISFGLKYTGNPYTNLDAYMVGLAFKLEKRIFGFLGIQGGVAYYIEPSTDSTKAEDYKLYGYEFSAAIPFYFGGIFCIRPEVGIFNGKAVQVINQTNETEKDVSSSFIGVTAGFAPGSKRHGGFELLLGGRKYSDSEVFIGNTAFDLSLGATILF